MARRKTKRAMFGGSAMHTKKNSKGAKNKNHWADPYAEWQHRMQMPSSSYNRSRLKKLEAALGIHW